MGENVEIKAGLCYNKRQTAQPKCEAEEESRNDEVRFFDDRLPGVGLSRDPGDGKGYGD